MTFSEAIVFLLDRSFNIGKGGRRIEEDILLGAFFSYPFCCIRSYIEAKCFAKDDGASYVEELNVYRRCLACRNADHWAPWAKLENGR